MLTDEQSARSFSALTAARNLTFVLHQMHSWSICTDGMINHLAELILSQGRAAVEEYKASIASQYQGYTADQILKFCPLSVWDAVGVQIMMPYVLNGPTARHTWEDIDNIRENVHGPVPKAVEAATPGIIRTCASVICFGCQENAPVAPDGCGGLIHRGGYGNCHAIALREKFPEAFEPDVRMQGRH
jgi:hypothetical protein